MSLHSISGNNTQLISGQRFYPLIESEVKSFIIDFVYKEVLSSVMKKTCFVTVIHTTAMILLLLPRVKARDTSLEDTCNL